MKDIKFFLRKRIKLLGGFSDYKKDTYKLFAIIPKDKYSINDQQLLKECSLTEDDLYYNNDNLENNFIIEIPYFPKVQRSRWFSPIESSIEENISPNVFNEFINPFLEDLISFKIEK